MKSNFFIDFHNAENNADYNGYTRQGEQEIAEQAGEEITLACKPGMLRARKSRKTGSERAESRIRAENYVISDNAEQRGAIADKKAEIKPALKNIPITISADTMQQNPTQTTAVILSLVIHIANMSATPIMLTIIGNTFFSESNSIFFFNS